MHRSLDSFDHRYKRNAMQKLKLDHTIAKKGGGLLKKWHFRHFKVLSFIKDSLLYEVDKWREGELLRLFEKNDPSVSSLTKEGKAKESARLIKKARSLRFWLIFAAVTAVVLLASGIAAAILFSGGTSGDGSSPMGDHSSSGDAPGHTHTLKTNTVSPTCTEGGYTEEICLTEGCNYRRVFDVLAALGHTERITEGKAPSETEDGYTEKVDCSTCGEVLETSTVIPALTHSYALLRTVAPTCLERGYSVYACTDTGCSASYQDNYVKANGHTSGTPIRENEIAADCTAEGSFDEVIRCSVCGDLISSKHTVIPVKHGAQTTLHASGDCTLGSAFQVVDCAFCGEEISRGPLTLEPQSEHPMENGACTLCGMPESTPGLEYEYVTGKNEYRVIGIGTCEEKDIVIGVYRGYTVSEVTGFAENKKIESLTLSDGVRTIDRIAFLNCEALSSLKMGSGVTTIDQDAFGGCTSLSEVRLGENVEVIDLYAFSGCKSLSGTFYIPASVTSIAYNAFSGTKIERFEVSEDNASYSSIDGNLYDKDGKKLIKYAPGKTETSFTVPDGVEQILTYAIACDSLTELVIPKSVSYIAMGAISSPVLSSVIFMEPDGWSTIFYEEIDARNLADPAIAAGYINDCDVGITRETYS